MCNIYNLQTLGLVFSPPGECMGVYQQSATNDGNDGDLLRGSLGETLVHPGDQGFDDTNQAEDDHGCRPGRQSWQLLL